MYTENPESRFLQKVMMEANERTPTIRGELDRADFERIKFQNKEMQFTTSILATDYNRLVTECEQLKSQLADQFKQDAQLRELDAEIAELKEVQKLSDSRLEDLQYENAQLRKELEVLKNKHIQLYERLTRVSEN